MDIYFDDAHEDNIEILDSEEDALLDLESVLDYLDDCDDGASLEL